MWDFIKKQRESSEDMAGHGGPDQDLLKSPSNCSGPPFLGPVKGEIDYLGGRVVSCFD